MDRPDCGPPAATALNADFCAVEHTIVDCRGEMLGDATVDDCGVCGGSSYLDGEAPLQCPLSVEGCMCSESWSTNLDGCQGSTFSGCQYHGTGLNGESVPCNAVFDGTVENFAVERPGMSFCEVSADCPSVTPFSVGDQRFDYCIAPPACGSYTGEDDCPNSRCSWDGNACGAQVPATCDSASAICADGEVLSCIA